MDSQAAVEDCEFGKGENVGDVGDARVCGIDEQGQASPRETPLIAVRDAGQMGARPVMRTFQRTGRTTIGIEDACVVGCDNR
jgi:hypothetical protein